MSRKPWRELQFIKQIVIKPEDPKNPMWVDFKEEDEWEFSEYPTLPRQVSRDRSIKLGANTMYSIESDYPENFKKLVAATANCDEAYRLYQALQKKVPDNWADYAEEGVW